MPVKPIPDGYHTATPFLIIRGAAAALEFYKKALGAKEISRYPMPDGTIAHAEIQIGNSRIMLGEESPQQGFRSPATLGGSGTGICLYVEDVDMWFKRAVDAGGKVSRPVVDQFYGDRSGTLTDPYGHVWTISTHVEDVSEEEMARRMKAHDKA
ncbi:MAG TPA: VOC family protein [Patescibacteria group bacterium]|nr:VOC family protein [Patescibacteria group bacterium]